MKSRDLLIAEIAAKAAWARSGEGYNAEYGCFGKDLPDGLDLPAIIASVPGDEPVAEVDFEYEFADVRWLLQPGQRVPTNGTKLYTSPQPDSAPELTDYQHLIEAEMVAYFEGEYMDHGTVRERLNDLSRAVIAADRAKRGAA